MENVIELKDVGFSYRDSEGNLHPALSNINLSFEKGSYTAILGHNGSGKSTLAKLLNLVITSEDGKIDGSVKVFGKELNGQLTEDEEYEIRRRVGMVHQNPDDQIVATTVEEDVAFGPENLGVEPAEIRKTVDEAIAAVGMTGYEKFAPHRLSGGQKQRVAVAGVLAMHPECIIFDESTAMLDPEGREAVLKTIDELHRSGDVTVITITHYMNEATDADRVVVLNHGEVFMNGTPEEIFTQVDKLRSVSLGVPQVTELFYRLKKEGVYSGELPLHTKDGAAALSNLVKNKRG
ncbi:MAG: energy-coupling factor transporter ATPase [Clostridia bacterium]|nr:energy-coupling factor transporter ATPase [Clostridia bacterium]MBQ3869975.1 energy-coupling factor transporter ATPase [Clostridia bacterium]